MQFLLMTFATLICVVALRGGTLVYQSARNQTAIDKAAVAVMLVESVSLWLGLTVAMAAVYAIRHAV
jgi:hypothetical protein